MKTVTIDGVEMTDNKEPRVTECWVEPDRYGRPDIFDDLCISSTECYGYHPALVLWREDYDAMRKELEELRQYKSTREADDAYRAEQIERERVNKIWGLEEKWDGSKE